MLCNLIDLSAGSVPTAKATHEPGQVVIKFEATSLLGQKWIESGRNTQVDFITEIIGDHTSQGYIDNFLLQGLEKSNVSQSRLNSLERICLIKYTAEIDPQVLAGKLNNLPELEYAEAVPINELTSEPNDTLYKEQYYLDKIGATEAWDYVEGNDSIVVGIVDTGINYNHVDLKGSMFSNPGETGFDAENNDKSTNGIDDDNNGFIDDWHGWDFASSAPSGMDNDPFPGHKHGTHVGGTVGAMTNNITGIAGTFPRVKLLPVKVGKDASNSTSVHNGYQGILYAAILGAKVINCSWGSNNMSLSDLEILKTVEEMGIIVVAAAGNNGRKEKFFPAGYITNISVASVTSLDRKSSFSNYHPSVDISAPGNKILATVFETGYQEMQGTSMSAPIVSGVAAMLRAKFPDLSPLQIGELIKSSSVNIDQYNLGYLGMLGRGRIDALEAVQDKVRKSIILTEFDYINEYGDKIINPGERIDITISMLNVLTDLKGVNLKTVKNDQYSPEYTEDQIFVGDLKALQSFTLDKKFSFVVSDDVPFDYALLLEFDIYDEDGYVNRIGELVNVKPSYRTMSSNNFTLTFTSRGNYGYNDYPSNSQGEGIRYKQSQNLLYEGGLIIAHSQFNISNNIRGYSQSKQDKDFVSLEIFDTRKDGIYADEEGFGFFNDHGYKSEAGVKVIQDVYQFDDPEKEDIVYVKYRVINTTNIKHDSLFVALFFDYDISSSGKDDKISFNREQGFGAIRDYAKESSIWLGTSMLSDHDLVFYAIDNNGNLINLWNGFNDEEKWTALDNGIGRENSSITDCSLIIGAGPLKSNPGDTSTVVFGIYGGEDLIDLQRLDNTARISLPAIGEDSTKYYPKPTIDTLLAVYPNPSDGLINVDFAMAEQLTIDLLVIDELGRTVAVLEKDRTYNSNHYSEQYNLYELSTGRYYLQMKSAYGSHMIPFEIYRN
jgi:serine protease